MDREILAHQIKLLFKNFSETTDKVLMIRSFLIQPQYALNTSKTQYLNSWCSRI